MDANLSLSQISFLTLIYSEDSFFVKLAVRVSRLRTGVMKLDLDRFCLEVAQGYLDVNSHDMRI